MLVCCRCGFNVSGLGIYVSQSGVGSGNMNITARNGAVEGVWLLFFPTLFFFYSIGGFFSSLFSGLFGTREMRILILGLDGAGKTTILYRLQVGEVVTTIPSQYHSVWTLRCRHITEFRNFELKDLMMTNFVSCHSYWFQRGDSDIQEPKVPGVGSWWPDQYQVCDAQDEMNPISNHFLTQSEILYLETLALSVFCMQHELSMSSSRGSGIIKQHRTRC